MHSVILLKKTVKTAKSASTRDDLEKETIPLQLPPPPGCQEGVAPEETKAHEEVEALDDTGSKKGRKKIAGGPTKKPPVEGKLAQNPDDSSSSSSSSSSSDSDDTGASTIESLLRHRRQDRLRKKGKRRS